MQHRDIDIKICMVMGNDLVGCHLVIRLVLINFRDLFFGQKIKFHHSDVLYDVIDYLSGEILEFTCFQ